MPRAVAAGVPRRIPLGLSGGRGSSAQGARLIGIYDSQVAFGQSRVLLVWTRLIMPNGRSIVLERQQGADAEGYSGLEDEVNNHWGELFKAALYRPSSALGQSWGPVRIPETIRPFFRRYGSALRIR